MPLARVVGKHEDVLREFRHFDQPPAPSYVVVAA